MIDIKKNSINKISIDIDQYEYYLIEFTSDSNCESVTAIFSNSGFSCDYPIIQIEETNISNIDVLLGKINLPYLGFWSANIYGNIDGANLDTGLATFLIEEDVRVYRGAQEEEVDNNNYLIVENNLSDVDDVTTSQNNLNVYDKNDVYTKTEIPVQFVESNDNDLKPNICANSAFNTIDPLTDTNIIAGGGRSGNFPNKIGSPTKPNGLDVTPFGWVDDTGYVAGSASVATITGGYDGIQNQLAGVICGGGHNFMPYNVFAHSFIGGGSYNVNAGGRGAIVGGRGNAIGNDVQFAFIGGGDGNIIRDQASFSSILNGFYCTVWGSARSIINGGLSNIIRCIGAGNIIASGENNTIGDNETTDLCERCVINGGNDNKILNSLFSFIGTGQTNSIDNADYSTIINGSTVIIANGADHSTAFGDDVTVEGTATYSFTHGLRVKSQIPGSHTFGARRNAVSGDCQNISFSIGNSTVDATAKYLAVVGGATYAPIENGACWTGVVFIQGKDTVTGNIYSGKIDFCVDRQLDVETIKYESRTDFIDDFVLTTKPFINLHTDGLFRVFVKGDVGDNIYWSGRVDITSLIA